jgi:hypothetical protein
MLKKIRQPPFRETGFAVVFSENKSIGLVKVFGSFCNSTNVKKKLQLPYSASIPLASMFKRTHSPWYKLLIDR